MCGFIGRKNSSLLLNWMSTATNSRLRSRSYITKEGNRLLLGVTFENITSVYSSLNANSLLHLGHLGHLHPLCLSLLCLPQFCVSSSLVLTSHVCTTACLCFWKSRWNRSWKGRWRGLKAQVYYWAEFSKELLLFSSNGNSMKFWFFRLSKTWQLPPQQCRRTSQGCSKLV